LREKLQIWSLAAAVRETFKHEKQTWLSNDITVIELGYREIVIFQRLADQLFSSAFDFGN